MLLSRSKMRSVWLIAALLFLAGCNDPDERKTHYVTVYLSQDVEIREILVDLDLKKPGVVVVHPEGVEVKHHPTKPKKTVSFTPLPPAFAALALILAAASLGLLPRRSFRNGGQWRRTIDLSPMRLATA